MKARFNKTTARTLGAITASLVLVVSFQNCGKAGFDSDLDDTLDSASLDAALTTKYGTTNAAKVTDIPFAFDGGFDQIAYNSCAESGSLTASSAYYSIKAGAYQNYGLGIKSDYFSYVDSNFLPIYPATAISKAQYEEYLGDSPNNIGAIPTMAVRDRANLTSVYSPNSSLALYTDVMPMVDTLTSTYVMETLVSDRSLARFFPFSSNYRRMESALKYNSDQSLSNSLRDILGNAGQLTLTYMNDSTQVSSVMSASTASSSSTTTTTTSSTTTLAYGKGYRFSFSQPTGVFNSYVPQNIVTAVQEVDLSTAGITANWSCDRVYKIVLVRDSTNSSSAGYCPPHTTAELATASIRQELEIVRRQFRADQWEVNVTRKCMVPKGTTPSCYVENTVNGTAQGVQYDATASCYNPLIGNSTADYPNGIIPTARCMNYATICTRGF